MLRFITINFFVRDLCVKYLMAQLPGLKQPLIRTEFIVVLQVII